MTQPLNPDHPLVEASREIEAYVSRSDWDQPARLFALAKTLDLIEAEPSLADQLTASAADSLSSIEQEDFHAGDDLLDVLAQIRWPESVEGVALSTERCFLPAELEDQLPEDPALIPAFVADHPQREDIRVIVAVLRDGSTHTVARLKSHPDERLEGPGMIPVLERALMATLESDNQVPNNHKRG